LKALAGHRIVATMLGRGGIKDPRAEATLLIFFAKTRMGWSEKTIHEHTGAGGGPIKMTIEELTNARQRNLELGEEVSRRVAGGVISAFAASREGEGPGPSEPSGGA